MVATLSIVFLLGFLVVWPLAIAYFFALHKFGQLLQSLHPQTVATFREQERMPKSSFSRSYALFNAIESGRSFTEPLSSQVMAQYKSTRVLLYSAAAALMCLLFSGLGLDLVT
jgi:hypothetical protein